MIKHQTSKLLSIDIFYFWSNRPKFDTGNILIKLIANFGVFDVFQFLSGRFVKNYITYILTCDSCKIHRKHGLYIVHLITDLQKDGPLQCGIC